MIIVIAKRVFSLMIGEIYSELFKMKVPSSQMHPKDTLVHRYKPTKLYFFSTG